MSKIKSVEELSKTSVWMAGDFDPNQHVFPDYKVDEIITQDRQAFEEVIVEAFRRLQVQPTEHGITRDDSVHNQALDQAIATVRAIYQGNK